MSRWRNNLKQIVPAVLLPLAGAGCAWASESGGHGGEQLVDFLYRVLDIGVTAGLLYFFLRKPLGAALRQRRDGLRDELEQAKRLQADAERRFEACRQQLADADARIAALSEEIAADGQRQSQQLEAQAQSMATEIRAEAARSAEREIAAAKRQLRETAVELAVELAEARLKQQLSTSDQARLVDDYLARTGEQS